MLRREVSVIDADKENVKVKSSKQGLPTRQVLASKSTNLQLKKSTTSTNLGIKKPSLRRSNSSLPQIPQLPPVKNVFNRGDGHGPIVKRKNIEIVESDDDLEITFDTDQNTNGDGLAQRMGLILEEKEDLEDVEIEIKSKRDLPDLEDPTNNIKFTKDILDGIWNNKEVNVKDPLNLDLKLEEATPLDLDVPKNDDLELEFSDCDNEQDKLDSIMEFYK